jgi:hypothetical protein
MRKLSRHLSKGSELRRGEIQTLIQVAQKEIDRLNRELKGNYRISDPAELQRDDLMAIVHKLAGTLTKRGEK